MKKAVKLAYQIGDLENTLTQELSKLENWGKECKCLSREVIDVVDDLNIIRYCLECGGCIEI